MCFNEGIDKVLILREDLPRPMSLCLRHSPPLDQPVAHVSIKLTARLLRTIVWEMEDFYRFC